MISILISPVIGADNKHIENSVAYRTFVNQYHGFHTVYKVLGTSINGVHYSNSTLNIYRGDKVLWINDEDTMITIISKQNLWNDKGGFLTGEYKEFNYTFNKSGIYYLYIKEVPGFRQKIIVGPIEKNSTKNVTNVKRISANTTKSDLKPNSTNTPVIKQSTIKTTSRFDTFILVMVLLSIYVLSGKIKDH